MSIIAITLVQETFIFTDHHSTMAMSYTEDDVMKMRLLVDGDGTGDDRKLNILLKTLIRWCNADDDQQSCEVL